MPTDIQLQIAELGKVLAFNTESEPPHEKALREGQRSAAFAADVLMHWGEQKTHRGHRALYGLTKDHASYAGRVRAWSWYAADVAKWMKEPFHRETMQRMEQIGRDVLGDRELAALELRPALPTEPRPETMRRPPHWPEDAAAVGALETFMGALDPSE